MPAPVLVLAAILAPPSLGIALGWDQARRGATRARAWAVMGAYWGVYGFWLAFFAVLLQLWAPGVAAAVNMVAGALFWWPARREAAEGRRHR